MSASSTLVEPAFRSAPPFTNTAGPEVADLCDLVGFTPDPEQRLALDLIFGQRSGRSAAFEAAVVCSRQNLKTGLFKQCALGWLFITDQRLVVWSAHEFRTAQEAFRDMSELVEGSDWVRRRVKAVYRGNGDEAIELTTGQRLIFKARTKGGGRGLSGDKVVLDEAFALQATHMGALLPTLSARPDPQVVYGSSAGMADSEVLRDVRDRGRAGDDPRLVYLEWCDDLGGSCAAARCDHERGAVGCRLDDEARWARSNPALGRRISLDYIRGERRALPPAEFARERLGWWDEPDSETRVVAAPVWNALERQVPSPLGPVFGVEVALDRSCAKLGAAWMVDGRAHVEVVESRTGVDWVVPRLVTLLAEYDSPLLVVDKGAEAASLLTELERAGNVLAIGHGDRAAACGGFYDSVIEGAVSHNGDPQLAEALAAARWKDVGEGLRVFSRRRSAGDIQALYAVVLALHGLRLLNVDVSGSVW